MNLILVVSRGQFQISRAVLNRHLVTANCPEGQALLQGCGLECALLKWVKGEAFGVKRWLPLRGEFPDGCNEKRNTEDTKDH